MGKFARKVRRQHRRCIVRSVPLSASQFNDFLFPVWANAQNPGDPEVVIRITRKLKRVSEEVPLTPAQQAAVDAGRRVYADRKLVGESVTLFFEEDERNVLRDAFKKALQHFNPFAMEEAWVVFEALRDAPSTDQVTPSEPEFTAAE